MPGTRKPSAAPDRKLIPLETDHVPLFASPEVLERVKTPVVGLEEEIAIELAFLNRVAVMLVIPTLSVPEIEIEMVPLSKTLVVGSENELPLRTGLDESTGLLTVNVAVAVA
jgi:hypothetical protein